MKHLILAFTALLTSCASYGQASPGAIFSGDSIKLLKDNLLFKTGAVKILTGDTDDPTSVAKNAPQGSLYIRSGTGAMYQKQDSGSSTNWSLLLIAPISLTSSVSGVLPLANGGTNKNITASAGSIFYSDADSFELLAPGTAGRPLLSGSTPAYFTGTGYVTAASGVLSGVLGTANQLAGVDAAGTSPEFKTLSGTSNQVTVTHGVGTVTLSTPQNIATSSDVTFNTISLGAASESCKALSAAPGAASSFTNKCYYDTTTKTVYWSDGTNWAIQGVQPAVDTESLEYRASLSDGTAGIRFTVASFTTTGTSYVTPTDDSGNARTNFVNGSKPVWVTVAFKATILSNSTTISVIRSTGTTTIMQSDQVNTGQASVFVSAPFRLEANESFYLSTNNTIDTTTPYFLAKIDTIGSTGTYSIPSSGAAQIKWPASTTSCAGSTSSATFADIVDTDCSFAASQTQGPVATPTTTGGIALKRSTAIAAGKYKIGFTGVLLANASTTCSFQLTDGTNVIGPILVREDGAGVVSTAPGIPASIITYTSSTTPEWKLQGKRVSGASVCEVIASSANDSIAIHMEPIDEVITASLANTPQFPNSTQTTPVSYIATVDCDAGSTITNETLTGTPTIGNIASGACVITLPSGNLATIGYVMPNFEFTDGTGRMAKWTMTSTTSVTVNCYEDDGTNCADFDGIMTLTQY